MLSNAEFLGPGIVVYRDVFTKEMNLVNRLENSLDSQKAKKYQWRQATTGYSHTDLSYRDCFDFKIKLNDDNSLTVNNEHFLANNIHDEENDLKLIWQDSKSAQVNPINDYRNMFNIAPLNYWECFNFVKYGKDQHFQIHSDHGYSYICVLSSVGYINDDYEGGELFFDKFNLKIKPQAGDLYLFPSSFIYSHAALPVTSGTKYSIVTMLDYLEAPHCPDYFDIEARYSKGLL
jgi:hypothetical protein